MEIPLISTLFRSKSHDAGWFAVGLGAHGVYLAKVEFAGVMPRVKRCEYHETGTVSADVLGKLRREVNLDGYAFTTLLAPGE